MDFVLDLERVLLGMLAGAVILMIAAVRPNLPADGGDRIAGAVWARFNIGAFAVAVIVIVLASVRLADGADDALVHVIGGGVLLALLLVKSRMDARMTRRAAAATGSEADAEAMRRDVARMIPIVVVTLLLSLGLALGPA